MKDNRAAKETTKGPRSIGVLGKDDEGPATELLLAIGIGAIGVEELEEPLLALGLVGSREEVVALMSKVDKDNQITFEEFLALMSSAKNTSKE